MSSNTSPPRTPLAGPVNQKLEKARNETPKGTSQRRRERRKSKTAEVAKVATGITPSSSQTPSTPTTIVGTPVLHGNDLPTSEKEKRAEAPTGITPSSSQRPALVYPTASHGNNQPISASAPVPPPSFTFGPITNAFGQSPQASLTEIEPKPFTFGPATKTFTQAPPRPPNHKTSTEVEANLRVTTAKAETQSKADQEISALTTKLEKSKMVSDVAKKELETRKTDLEKSKTELARAKKELKSSRARTDGMATDLDRIIAHLNAERTARQGVNAELAVAREALVASNKKLSNGLTLTLLLWLLALVLLGLVLLGSFYLCWSIWTNMQLQLAVVSRVGSAHMYPKLSEDWMLMDQFGWFGD